MGTLCLRPMQGLALCVYAVSVGSCCTFRQCSMGSAPNSTRQTATATRHEVSVLGVRALTTYPPGTKAFGPAPRATPHPLLEPRPLVYLPLPHQVYPPHPPGQLRWVPPPHPLRNLLRPWGLPPAPRNRSPWTPSSFPQPSWNQGPWSTPPSTRPAPVGTPTDHPSKNVIFFLFRFAPSLRSVPLPPTPPEPKALALPPSP